MPWSGSSPNKTFSRSSGSYSGATTWQQTDAASRGIRADDADTHDQDLSDGIDSSLQKDGKNKATADIDFGGYGVIDISHVGSVTEASIASSGTTDLLGSTSLFNSITGTTTITSLGTGTKRLKIARFTGALLLTHNATSLILPGGANITTAAGDTMLVVSDASSNARVLAYQKADGTAAVLQTMASLTDGDSWTAETTVASASTCDILGAASDFIAISGTTTITSFGTGTNKIKFVRATGAHLLTHNATSLILPTGANITTASGDTYFVISDGSSNARVFGYQRASGEPLTLGLATLFVPAAAMVANTTNGPASGTVEVATNLTMLRTLDFDATTAESAQFAVQMPVSWNEGTVTAKAVWKHAATTTNFGVVWDVAGGAYSDGDDPAAFGTAQTMTDTGGTTNRIYISPTSSAITIAGTPAAGDWVVFRVRRAPSDGSDTMAIDAGLLGISIFYTVDSLKDG